jgi:acyl carrier protein
MAIIDRVEFEETLYTTLSKLAGVPRGDIRPGDRLRDDLGLDSLKSMELLSRISERYDIDPDMEDVMAMETVEDVLAHLSKYIAQ